MLRQFAKWIGRVFFDNLVVVMKWHLKSVNHVGAMCVVRGSKGT